MIVAGLTGSIASGKSTVARMLERLGTTIIDADEIARQLTAPGEAVLSEIVRTFGGEILNGRGELNRKELGRIVFGNPEKRAQLNAILHPEIIAEERRRVKEIERTNPHAVAVIDAALLIESGNYREVDFVIVVAAPEETLLRRAMQRDGLSREEVLDRLNAQWPLEKKRQYADSIIENDGSIEALQSKVEALYRELYRRANPSGKA